MNALNILLRIVLKAIRTKIRNFKLDNLYYSKYPYFCAMFQEKFAQKIQPFIKDQLNPSFLLAVSGGVDSMVLLWLFCHLKFEVQNLKLFNQIANLKSQILNFQVAHINYKLRGEDSDLDQKLVQNFCEKHGIKLHIYEVSERDNCPKNGSIQLWARELRYRFFREIQEQEKLDFLATAHHLNDQLETFFINLSRGSGLAGLCGIPTDENRVFRPLLEWSKAEIYNFAKDQNIPYREDISNQKNDYLRNKIRNKIVPELQEINADFLGQFHKSLRILSDTKYFVNQQINQILSELTLRKNDEVWVLDKGKLAQKSDFEKFEILRKFGFENELENTKIFTAETGKVFHSQEFSLLINREELVFSDCQSSIANRQSPILQQLSDDEYFISLENFQLSIKNNQPKTWLFDKNKIKFPLKIRKRQEGDFFYPIGMQGKKKVSKFLKDEKISQWDKEKIHLLCDAEDNILGVIPLRQDGRFFGKNINIRIII